MDGKTYKFSGFAQDAEAFLTKRNVGELDIALGIDYAVFEVDDDDDSEEEEAEGGMTLVPRVSPLISEIANLGSLRVGVAVEGELSLDDDVKVESVRWSGKELPSGVKVSGKTSTFTGVPKKAGSGVATILATCKFNVPGQTKVMTAKVARKAEWQVAPLDDWAYGKFNSEDVKISINKTGGISGYVVANGKKNRISAKSFTAYEDGKYTAAGNSKGSNFEVTVTKDGLSVTLGTITTPLVTKTK